MIKADIVNRVADATDVPRVKAAQAVDTIIEAMREALAEGKRIELRGFGVFQVRDRKKGVGMRLYLSTSQNVDEIAKRAKNAGFTLKSEPQNTEWKTRAFEVTDPSGFLLTISSEAAT